MPEDAVVVGEAKCDESPLGGRKAYVAQCKDSSLRELLVEVFRIAEIKYANIDQDKAGVLMFPELKRNLTKAGFHNEGAMMRIWKDSDADNDGNVNFGEFLHLLYQWQYMQEVKEESAKHLNATDCRLVKKMELAVESYSVFFKYRENAEICARAFSALEENYKAFDKDQNKKLCRAELDEFLSSQLPFLWKAETTTPVLDEAFPQNCGHEIRFATFLGLLYVCISEFEPDRVTGRYKDQCMDSVGKHPAQTALFASLKKQDGEASEWCKGLKDAFSILESDFETYDSDGNGRVDLAEIVKGGKVLGGREDRLDFISRMQHNLMKVDLDRSGDLDFWQFCFLAFLMTMDGSYNDLVLHTKDATIVKKSMIGVQQLFQSNNPEKNYRMPWDQTEKALISVMGSVPARAKEEFDKLSYVSSSSPGQHVLDLPRFLHFCYDLLLPEGRYVATKYNPPPPKSIPREKKEISLPMSQRKTALFTIDPVDPSLVVKLQKLGEGGQGVVYKATYREHTVAAKFLHDKVTSEVCRQTQKEVDLMRKLDHPHVHHLVGALVTPSDICILTEICPHGSIFDYYTKKLMPVHCRFDDGSARRLALEVALALQVLHSASPSFMHRDLKSLNIFLDEGMVAKLADFGMATSHKTSTESCGTVQWMAPEVLANVTGKRNAYDLRSDMFSFGVVLWELFHCRCPYAETGLDQMAIAKKILREGMRPKISSGCPADIKALIKSCMHTRPPDRPTIDTVVESLQQPAPKAEAKDSKP